MFAYTVWINKLFDILEYQTVVGIKEALDDYDYETEQYVVSYTNDRQFRVKSGNVYCRGGSVTYSRPVTDEDGWEIEPLENPFHFFEDLLDNGCVQEVYVFHEDTHEHHSIPIWDAVNGWLPKREIIKCIVSPSFLKKSDTEVVHKPVLSLKVLAGLVTLDVIGPMCMREIEYCLDKETCQGVLKPSSWWIAL